MKRFIFSMLCLCVGITFVVQAQEAKTKIRPAAETDTTTFIRDDSTFNPIFIIDDDTYGLNGGLRPGVDHGPIVVRVPSFPHAGGTAVGDVNGDGNISIGDVSGLIDLILSGSVEARLPYDVDGDGTVSICDVSMLIDMLMGTN